MVLILACASCADETGSSSPPDEVTLVDVPGEPAAASAPEFQELPLPAYASSVAATDNLVIAGTSSGALAFGAESAVFLGPSDVTIDAFAAEGAGLLVFMQGAVGFTTGASVEALTGLDPLAEVGVRRSATRWVVGDDDELVAHHTLLGSDAVYELVGPALTRWPVEGESSAPSAAFAGEQTLLIAYGQRLYEIDRGTKQGHRVQLDLGTIVAIACDSSSCGEESRFYFATSRGLVERSSATTYSRYPLVEASDSGVAVNGFALDPTRQRLYAWTDDALLLVRSSGVPQSLAALETDEGLPRLGAVDSVGDLWLGHSTTLTKFETGTPLSFATDIQPIMAAYCATCHAAGTQGAPTIDFEEYDVAKARVDRIVARMSDATMPPSEAPSVPADKLKLVLTWATDVEP